MNEPQTMTETRSIKSWFILLIGHLSLLLGLIALLLPVVPTSPFLVVAAACYARTSPRFRKLLIENKHVGPAILKWEQNRCLELKHKILFILILALAFSSSAFLFMETQLAKLVMLAVGGIAIIYVGSIKVCDGGRR
ncbi:MAG: DUF454 domain-containing protein [Gammaproteobacteria bacterium]|nr:DUF454 domain-containing protein [Gammaproteobacteria bacterium]